MRVMVTGSRGMLGRALCRRLDAEHAVIEAHRGWFDVTDESSTRKAIASERPDVVVHAAAYTRVDDCETHREAAFAVNAAGTRHVALGCLDCGAWMLYVSTDYVYDGEKGRPYVEEDPTAPLGVYGASKLEGERELARLGIPHMVVRTSWLFGPGGSNFVRTVYGALSLGRPLKVVDDQVGSPTYTVDLADAVARLLAVQGRGVVHVANAGACSWFQLARAVLEATGRTDVPLTPISSRDLGRPARRPRYSVLDTGRYTSLTGHRLRPWRDALREYLEAEGWLDSKATAEPAEG